MQHLPESRCGLTTSYPAPVALGPHLLQPRRHHRRRVQPFLAAEAGLRSSDGPEWENPEPVDVLSSFERFVFCRGLHFALPQDCVEGGTLGTALAGNGEPLVVPAATFITGLAVEMLVTRAVRAADWASCGSSPRTF
jgi:hypothetical protein